MGVRLTSTTTAALTTAGTTLSFSHDGGSGSNRLLVVAVATRSTSATVSALTYNGVALTSVGALSQSTSVRLEVWRLIAPATGTNTVAVTVGASTAVAAWARTFEDVHQTTPLGTAVTGGGTSAAPSVAPVANDSDLMLDALAYQGSAPDPDAPGAEQAQSVAVESVLGGTLSNNVGLAGSTQPGGAAADTMSWTLSASAAYAALGVAVKATGTGTTLARVSQLEAEVLVLPTGAAARVSQLAADVLLLPDAAARVSQLSVDVLVTGYPAAAPTPLRTTIVTAG